MSIRNLSFNSSSTGSILSLKAQTSYDESLSEADYSPVVYRMNHNNESMVTLFAWNARVKIETNNKVEPITVGKCKCVLI